ncbi:hypothetical protein [uncultured Brevundimonas sp.]|uniref:hypothetical protein n=1 Tax=uncultured Brevundimonas sp. TaxID=213418 RepID=UPI0025E093AD|nr:hypothetical protein [uncultured Brevundimonas sp.]
MSLWEIGKLREGWVAANSLPKKEGEPVAAKDLTDEEFAKLMAVEIVDSDQVISFEDAIQNEKTL